MAKAIKKRRNLFGFGKKKVTYHARIVRRGAGVTKKPRSIRYMGTSIIPLASGKYTVAFDRDSHFDDLRTAKAFVKSWEKNPAKFDRCVSKVSKSLQKRGKPGNAYAICSATRAKQRNPKRNPATLLWNSAQGAATADVYMLKRGKFEIDVANASKKHTYKAASLDSAKAIARQKLREYAANPDPSIVPGADYANTLGKAGKRLVKGVSKSVKKLLKRNPVDQAVVAYEQFHGLPVNEVIEVQAKEHRHSVTWGVGRLICIELIGVDGKPIRIIAPGFTYKKTYWDFDESTPPAKVVYLTCGEDNKQLLLDGGDQSLDLKALGFEARDYHDSMFIGTIDRIWYRTIKSFEGDEEVDFHHKFGSEGSRGVLPVLNYKPKNPSLEIVGGRYEIALPDKSLGNVSPGIVG